jgi:hypothetical protein
MDFFKKIICGLTALTITSCSLGQSYTEKKVYDNKTPTLQEQKYTLSKNESSKDYPYPSPFKIQTEEMITLTPSPKIYKEPTLTATPTKELEASYQYGTIGYFLKDKIPPLLKIDLEEEIYCDWGSLKSKVKVGPGEVYLHGKLTNEEDGKETTKIITTSGGNKGVIGLCNYDDFKNYNNFDLKSLPERPDYWSIVAQYPLYASRLVIDKEIDHVDYVGGIITVAGSDYYNGLAEKINFAKITPEDIVFIIKIPGEERIVVIPYFNFIPKNLYFLANRMIDENPREIFPHDYNYLFLDLIEGRQNIEPGIILLFPFYALIFGQETPKIEIFTIDKEKSGEVQISMSGIESYDPFGRESKFAITRYPGYFHTGVLRSLGVVINDLSQFDSIKSQLDSIKDRLKELKEKNQPYFLLIDSGIRKNPKNPNGLQDLCYKRINMPDICWINLEEIIELLPEGSFIFPPGGTSKDVLEYLLENRIPIGSETYFLKSYTQSQFKNLEENYFSEENILNSLKNPFKTAELLNLYLIGFFDYTKQPKLKVGDLLELNGTIFSNNEYQQWFYRKEEDLFSNISISKMWDHEKQKTDNNTDVILSIYVLKGPFPENIFLDIDARLKDLNPFVDGGGKKLYDFGITIH